MALSLDWLPDELNDRRIPFKMMPDFYTHGRPYTHTPWGTIWHHTASGLSSTRATNERILHDGRTDVPGPISQLCCHRHPIDGEPLITLIGAGYANHAGKGWWPLGTDTGNRGGIGLEWVNNGVGEPAHPAAVEASAMLLAVIHDHYGWGLDRAWTHAAYAPGRKIDPAAPALHTNDIYRTWTLAECRTLIAQYMGSTSGDDMYVPLPDQRFIDTRWPGFDALKGGQVYPMPRPPRIPANAKSIRMNITAVAPAGQGFITAGAWADGAKVPEASKLNYKPQTAPICNEVDVYCEPGGTFKLFSHVDTDLVIDVCGYTV